MFRVQFGRLDVGPDFRWRMEVCSWFIRFRVPIPATLPDLASP